jgi:outer membrane usher protein
MNRPACWLLCFWLAPVQLPAAVQSLPLPATLNQQPVGELTAWIDGQQLRGLDINPIRPRLRELLAPDRYELIRTNLEPEISPSLLETAGVHTGFDFQNLKVDLTIRTEAIRRQTLDLMGNPNFTAGATVKPSDFSAYMNFRGGVSYTDSSQSGTHGFSDPQLDFESAFNYRGVVLQNETVVNPAPGKDWEKRDTRLVWDQPKQRLRWELGDLDYPVTGFQGFLTMAGLSLHKEDSLQPYRLTSPLGQSAFFLREDSKVEVIVNGHTIQTLQMSAGPHQISNFPLTSGANDVILRVTDPVGRVEYINAKLFYDPGLLRAGEREFNVAVGWPSITDPGSPFYRYSSRPAGSAFYRYGFTDRLTAGIDLQATEDTQLGGGQAVLSTRAGIFSFDSAASQDRALGWGYAERLQYQYYVPRSSLLADGVFSLGGQYESAGFALPNPFSIPTTREATWNAQASYSQRIAEHWTAGISYGRQWAGGRTQRATYDLIAGFFWKGLRANVTVEHLEVADSKTGWSAFFLLTWNFTRGQSLYSSYDSSSRISRSEWQYTQPESIETLDATLGVQNSPYETSGYGNVRYTGRRAELTLSQDVLSSSDRMTSLHWGTALVYAGGALAVSRPVSDSFALLESTGSLREEGGLGVERQGQRFLGKEDWLGPAVLPQITGYYPTHLIAEPLRPGADFDPQTGDLRLEPTYRSGARIRLGQESTANITAMLLWADGKPASLQSGTLTASDGATMEFISNREGLIYLHGLKAGEYRAALANHPEAPFTVTIPASKQKDLNLEPIRVSITE